MDDKEKQILQLQEANTSRSVIASMLYNGKPKTNLKSLNKFMKNRGYIIKDDKYIKQDDECMTTDINSVVSTIENKDDNSMTNENTIIDTLISTEDSTNMTLVINDEIKKNFISFMDKYNRYEEMLDWFENKDDNSMTQVIEVVDNGIKIDLPEAEEKRTTIRVNSKIWDDFTDFCKLEDNKYFNKQDLISMALKEYMERNKNK